MQQYSTGNSLNRCSESEPFALQVIGDSMAPEFPDACVVVIEPSDQARHGMFVMALVEGVRWFRQYLKDDRGERLAALNDVYPAIALDGLDWQVEGVIMQRNLRRHQSPSGRREIKHYRYR